MINNTPVAGFQFTLSDNPNLLSFVQISGTERTEAFNISSNEIDDDVIELGLSFTGDVIASGAGPILSITYASSDQIGESELSLSNITLSDTNGQEVPVISQSGTITVTSGGGGNITQEITLNPFTFNMTSLNVSPDDTSV